MPKAAQFALVWSAERAVYELYEHGNGDYLLVCAEDASWFAWLDSHKAFSFQGQSGSVNLLKEARKGGVGYWYAYRRQGQRTVKQYAGRSGELLIARMEAAAKALNPPPQAASLLELETVVPQTYPVHASHLLSNTVPLPSATTLITSTTPQTQLLAPKLQLPRLASGLVVRERLFAQLDSGLECKLTLISAPAGCGKTTLIRQWLQFIAEDRELIPQGGASRPQSPVCGPQIAWLSLDLGDNDPMRFWRYVIVACQGFQPDVGQTALELLATASQPPFEPVSQEMILIPFLNDLTRCTQPGVLILEDYHLITDPQLHEAVTFFLDHLPATLHLVMLTRREPPLPLARLRASGDLCEIQASDLRFSSEETRTFLNRTVATPLAPEALTQVDTQLEGWAAGLRLFALALQGCESSREVALVLETFAGSHRPVLDYFVTEVLNAQPTPIQHFLLLTSMLGRLTGELCDAVLGDKRNPQAVIEPVLLRSSSFVLESLARANLFLEPLDGVGQWYRYHALFAEAMRYEAQRRFGDVALQRVLSIACEWYERHGLLAEAVEAAFGAHDPDRAAKLIEQIIGNEQFIFFNQVSSEANEGHTLRRWLEQIPKAIMRQHPNLCISYAISLLLVTMSSSINRPTELQLAAMLELAEEGYRVEGNTGKLGEVFAFQSMVVKQQGEIETSVKLARQALTLLPVEEMAWRGTSISTIGTGEHFAGRLVMARKLFLESCAISTAINNRTWARAATGMLCGVYIDQGQLHLAAVQIRQILAEAKYVGDRDDVGHCLIGLMHLSYEWNDLDTAEQEASEVLEVGKQIAHSEFQAQARLMLARIEHARGQTTFALQHIAALLEWLQPQPSLRIRWHEHTVRMIQASIQLATGDLAAAQRWAEWRVQDNAPLAYFQRLGEELLLARLLIAQNNTDQALALLAHCSQQTQREGYTRYTLETQLLIALAYAARKQVTEARQYMHVVLRSAAAEGYVRLFLDQGDALARLLRTSASSIRERPLITYIHSLLRAFDAGHAPHNNMRDQAQASALAEPLSAQEQRVLHLLVDGHSNPEIAAHLIVSVNTVKAHLKNIYRKLNVSNRVEAGAVARRLHVLDKVTR